MQNKKHAFTLVELMIVVTILAVLGTIAFLSFNGYARDARDVVRLNDVGQMKKTLELFKLQAGKYPFPDNAVDVTYSGGLLWKQGVFGETVVQKLRKLSEVPVDPLFDISYNYSLFNRSTAYQLGLVLEESSDFSMLNKNTVNALSNRETQSYIIGDYDLLDIQSRNGSVCRNVAVPSMIINNLPGSGALVDVTTYDFAYNNSYIVPSNYEEHMDITIPGFGFQISEVYNKCQVDSLADINSYILSLSAAYQQFNAVPAYDQVANTPRTLDFIHKSIAFLQKNGMSISNDIILMLNNAFIDTFEGTDNDKLVGEHISDTLSDWGLVAPATNTGAYIISSNTLQKTTTSSDKIKPLILQPKKTSDTTISLKITNFNSGNVKLYSRYTDANNYYGVDISSGGYDVVKMVAGTPTTLSSISTGISNGSNIQFAVSDNNIKLIINTNELENIIDTSLTAIGEDIVELTTSGMQIDDFSLYFN